VSNRLKLFSLFVNSFVVVVGVGFGGWAGGCYGGTVSTCVGGALGAVGGYFVVRLYFKWLMKIAAQRDGKFGKWLLGSLSGALCGVICTSFIHVLLVIIPGFTFSLGELGGGVEMWFVMMGFAEAMGAAAGFVVGGICTLVYMRLVVSDI